MWFRKGITAEAAKEAAMYLKDYSLGVMSEDVLFNYLPDDFIEAVYRKRELQYRIEDALGALEYWEEDYKPEGFQGSVDAAFLAERFLDEFDANIDENEQWRQRVEEAYSELEAA